MPPKRAKGLKQSSSASADPTAAAPPATKRQRTGDATPDLTPDVPAAGAGAGAADQEPLYIGDVEDDNEVAEASALLGAAKSRLFGAAAGSAEHTQGRTLMRAALHECSRLLALEESLPAADRVALRPVYAQALVWAAAAEEDEGEDEPTKDNGDMPSKHELISLAVDQLDALNEDNDKGAGVRTLVKLAAKIVLDESVGAKDALWKVYKSAAAAVSQDDREELAWVAVRRLEHLEPEVVAKWAGMCAKLWEGVKNEQACARGMGAVKLALGSVVVAEQGEVAAEDESKVNKKAVEEAEKTLQEALTLLTRAKDLDDHPSELVYQPLGDVCVQLGTAAELLDNIDDATHHYLMAVRFLEKAREHNAEAVDEDQIDQLKEVVRDLMQGGADDDDEELPSDEDDEDDDEEQAGGSDESEDEDDE